MARQAYSLKSLLIRVSMISLCLAALRQDHSSLLAGIGFYAVGPVLGESFAYLLGFREHRIEAALIGGFLVIVVGGVVAAALTMGAN